MTKARIDFPSAIGVWWASDTWPMPAAQEVARDIESMGYGSLWLPEIGFKDALIESAAFLEATERLVVGTGIANIHARLPETAEGGGRTLTALHPGRFVLGLGVSHGPLVARLGVDYNKPLATMRTYLDRMAALPEIIEPGSGRPTRLLAALGPKMIELSGTDADGAHPYLGTPAHTATAREILGPDKWVVPEQAVVVGSDKDTEDDAERLRRAHLHLQIYSGLPNYRNSWKRLGFDESDFIPGGSERLARGVVGMGSVEQAASTVTAHLDAGADHVLVQVLGDGNPAWDPRPALRELAAVLGLG